MDEAVIHQVNLSAGYAREHPCDDILRATNTARTGTAIVANIYQHGFAPLRSGQRQRVSFTILFEVKLV